MKIKNGAVWKDTQGNILHAHGGYIIKYEECITGMEKTDWTIFM